MPWITAASSVHSTSFCFVVLFVEQQVFSSFLHFSSICWLELFSFLGQMLQFFVMACPIINFFKKEVHFDFFQSSAV